MTPLAPVKWCKLIGPPVPGFNKTKLEWSVCMVFSLDNKEHSDFLDSLETIYREEHGKSARKHQHYLPVKPDKDNAGQAIVTFKIQQFTRRDGTTSEPPTIIDSNRNAWGNKLIGNGSKMKLQFDVYAWTGEAGCGITLQPLVGMVVDLVEYVEKERGSVEDFDPVPGGYVGGVASDEEIPF